jgi:hypothetical protein
MANEKKKSMERHGRDNGSTLTPDYYTYCFPSPRGGVGWSGSYWSFIFIEREGKMDLITVDSGAGEMRSMEARRISDYYIQSSPPYVNNDENTQHC